MMCAMRKALVLTILLVFVLLAVGVIAEAQQHKKIPTIGYLSALDPAGESTRSEAIRLELFKEAVPKIANVAVLYEPANPGSVLQMKEALAAARRLGLTIRPWEVRDADGFEKEFAALSKERPDGLYVIGGPLMTWR